MRITRFHATCHCPRSKNAQKTLRCWRLGADSCESMASTRAQLPHYTRIRFAKSQPVRTEYAASTTFHARGTSELSEVLGKQAMTTQPRRERTCFCGRGARLLNRAVVHLPTNLRKGFSGTPGMPFEPTGAAQWQAASPKKGKVACQSGDYPCARSKKSSSLVSFIQSA
jgi:hypothetical protein